MSAHELSFPFVAPYNRDLSDPDLWERSLRRSVHRREITEAARKHAARRKGAALAVTASMAPARGLAVRGAGVREWVWGRRHRLRLAAFGDRAALRSIGVLGDTGVTVAAVQRQVGVDDDGIFGPITRGAVARFQKRYGLPVTGMVDARTWTALFKSNVSFVGGGGKTVMTVYNGGGGAAAPDGGPRRRATNASAPPKRATTTRAKRRRRRRSAETTPATTSPNSASTEAATNRAATRRSLFDHPGRAGRRGRRLRRGPDQRPGQRCNDRRLRRGPIRPHPRR